MNVDAKILVGIPVVSGYKHTMEAIDSVVYKPNVHLLIIDNNATEDVKELFKTYKCLDNFTVIVNEKNVYVNPAWNQIMDFFLKGDFEICCLMNSDLTLQTNWHEVLRYWYFFKDKSSFVPLLVGDCVKVERMKHVEMYGGVPTQLDGGIAGVFITLNREQCELIYPIPSEIKVWFGDNWIYDLLRGLGHKIFAVDNLIAFHGLSQTIDRVEGVTKVIEEDKTNWDIIVKNKLNEKIHTKV
jgi:hypothetical protein